MEKLEVEVGEVVVIRPPRLHLDPSSTTVVKITPTGIIKTEDGRYWNTDGYERGDTGSWGRAHIEKMTDAYRDEVKRVRLLAQINAVRWKDCPTPILEAVVEHLK